MVIEVEKQVNFYTTWIRCGEFRWRLYAYEQQHNNESFKLKEDKEIQIKDNRKTFNYSNLQCPGPIVNISKEIKTSLLVIK